MNTAYRINAAHAVKKASDAVANWEAGVAQAKALNDAAMIAFAEGSLAKCRENLAAVRASVDNVAMWN